MENITAQIDARQLPPPEKQSAIFKTFDELSPGTTMELINDHDPHPLLYQFIAKYPQLFKWEYMEEGPNVWRVAITKKDVHRDLH